MANEALTFRCVMGRAPVFDGFELRYQFWIALHADVFWDAVRTEISEVLCLVGAQLAELTVMTTVAMSVVMVCAAKKHQDESCKYGKWKRHDWSPPYSSLHTTSAAEYFNDS